MATKLKIGKRGDEILIVHCCFSISQNFNCSYMAMSSLTYIPGFSVKLHLYLTGKTLIHYG
jgi:hypothetical protein